jgi:isoleucyl-tRNA synthetase
MAPFLSFTAEEAWKVFAPGKSASIFIETFWDLPQIQGANELLTHRWPWIQAQRAAVLKALEEARSAGEIGSSLQAEVIYRASGALYDELVSLGDDLKFVFITSKVTLQRVDDAADEGPTISASTATKCERCWHYRDDVGTDPAHPTICGRCASNLYGSGETRTVA